LASSDQVLRLFVEFVSICHGDEHAVGSNRSSPFVVSKTALAVEGSGQGGTVKYLLLICTDEPFEVEPGELDVDPWVAEMAVRGVRLTGNRLRPADDATTVRVRGGELLVTDGPFAETKEMMGGFDIIECADLDEAIEIASKHPIARYGMIEVRPFWTD
jgi:hypothetical protein